MCGIIGQFGENTDKVVFDAACRGMAHRGPDDEGFFYADGIALGHRRLSIIDRTSGGHQPMHAKDGRYTIIYNGELFNYIELKEELQSQYAFISESDTEVLLAAYCVWGEDMFKKLNGQFALAIWDAERKELLLARDHFGIKPLFYHREGNTVSFASEIKALLSLGITAKPNDAIIFEYLAYEIYDHTTETFFEGINAVAQGSYITIREGAFKETRYFDLKTEVAAQSIPTTEAAVRETFTSLLQSAIHLQLRSDVPVGITLSSGVDSSVMLQLTHDELGSAVHAFTSCLKDDVYNECQYIEPWVKSNADIVWHTSMLEPSAVWPMLQELVRVTDQPFGGMQTLQYYNLYKQTADTPVTVLLEGQGMDEILGGYGYFAPEKREAFLANFTAPKVKPPYLDAGFTFKHRVPGRMHFELPFEDSLRNAQYVDVMYRKLPRPLRFNDHISMAFSKELRVPYLDPRLVIFGLALPEEYKIKDGVHKRLLREMIKDRMPHAMRPKDHVEFAAFQTEWFRKFFEKQVWEIINSASFKARPYFNHEAVVKSVERFFAGEGGNSFFLWQLLNLELWFREYIN